MALKDRLIRNGLDVLYHSGVYRAIEPVAAGVGVIFTLHRVGPQPAGGDERFAPNSILEITPDFLAATIARVRERGFETVSLDEACARMIEGDQRQFAAFTLDDGYRDNLEFAAPIFTELACPYTIFVASGLVDREAALWWVGLERAIAAAEAIEIEIAGTTLRFRCDSIAKKEAAFEAVYWPLRAANEAERFEIVAGLCRRHGVELMAITEELVMGWDELAQIARDPLSTIGAHTVSHATLSGLSDAEMRREIADGRARLSAILGETPRHFAYPYGDEGSAGAREFAVAHQLGFATAVTTRKGVIYPEHVDHLTALPRVSLNGQYQALRYVDLFLSGAPFALLNRFRHVDAA